MITGLLPDNVFFMRIRGWLLKPFFGKCGKKLLLGRGVYFHNSQNIFLGDDVYISASNWFNAIDKISIGNEVMFGPKSIIISGEHNLEGGSFRFGPITKAPIIIGKGSWIGGNSSVLAGTIIGKSSVVGANSVVRSKFPDRVLIAGVPATIKKEL